ncbi:MAG: Amidase [Bacteroidota bacterium]|nr:Amidase [Bacteroidota bacterium]
MEILTSVRGWIKVGRNIYLNCLNFKMEKRVSAFSNDAMGNMDATGIAEAIKRKDISVEEVTEAAISRAEKVNGALNAIVLKTYEEARQYDKLAKDGVFYGVPSFIKDNEDIRGYPTQKGTGSFTAKPSKIHGKYIQQFLSTGLNYLGKSSLPEFGFICSTENERWGITRNPWHTDHTTGGSSSGSAALVASGVVPIATANDGAGSTRLPASCCGLVGLKPSRNRLYPMGGTESLPIQIVYSGVLTRSVRDTAAFYGAAEQYYHNRKLPKIGHVQTPLKRRLRIVFFENLPEGEQGHMDEDVWRVQLETVRLLESLGHKVEMMKVPIKIEEVTLHYLTYYGFLSYMTTKFGRMVLGSKVDRMLLEPFTVGLANIFRKNKLRLPKSLRTLANVATQTEKDIEKDFDVIMSCTTTKVTPKIGYFSPSLSFEEISARASDFATFLPLFNISGSPAISLPLGEAENGLPVGVQFAAPFGQDALLLELALELEEAKPFKGLYSE